MWFQFCDRDRSLCEGYRLRGTVAIDMAGGALVAVVGDGGREHALAWAVAKSEHVSTVYCGGVLTQYADKVSGILVSCVSIDIDLYPFQTPLQQSLLGTVRDRRHTHCYAWLC